MSETAAGQPPSWWQPQNNPADRQEVFQNGQLPQTAHFNPPPQTTLPIDFFAHILPASGWYIVCAFQQGREVPSHYMCPDLNALIVRINWCEARGDNVYFAIASYKSAEGIYFAEVKRFKKRCHANIRAIKSLIIEIDTRESKPDAHYANREEARAAVEAFCQSASIPLPTFVSSGGGLHCYWPLDCELDLIAWRKLANALKSACDHFKLHADPCRTADGASVLRPPGTTHRKTSRIVSVISELVGPYSVEVFDCLKAFAKGNSEQPPKGNKSAKAPRANTGSALLGEFPATDYPPAFGAEIVRECRQLQEFRGKRGVIPEPLWFACLGVLAFCKDGEALAHEWSRGDPRYDHAETQGKIDRYRAVAPTTCQRFHYLNPVACDGCPHEGEITSPIQLGRLYMPPPTPPLEPPPPLPTDPLLPPPALPSSL